MTDKGLARTTGALFLVSMTVSMVYTGAFAAALEATLVDVAADRANIVIGAILELINCFAVIGIAIALQTILKRYSQPLALAYVTLRAVECAILISGVVSGLSMLALGEARITAMAADHAALEALALMVLASKDLALQMGILVCGLGGLILTPMLWRLRLVPRLIAGLGLIGYLAVIASVVLTLFGLIDTKAGSGQLIYIPGGLFEALVFPLWLIFKGFSSPRPASEPA
jgi:hypothetical protein